jgi:hypothetical protein
LRRKDAILVLATASCIVAIRPTVFLDEWYAFLRKLNYPFYFESNLWNIAEKGAYYFETSSGLEKCIIEMKKKYRQTRWRSDASPRALLFFA